jgi:hypothetical protein
VTANTIRLSATTTTTDSDTKVYSFSSPVTVAAETFTLTTSWQRFSKTFTLGSTIKQFGFNIFSGTSSTALTGTAGADDSWYATGFQLEEGSVATPFERRPIGLELQLCQRYFETFTTSQNYGNGLMVLVGGNSSLGVIPINFKVSKRTSGTATLVNVTSKNNNDLNYGANRTLTLYFPEIGITGGTIYVYPSAAFAPTTSGSALIINGGTIQVSAEL